MIVRRLAVPALAVPLVLAGAGSAAAADRGLAPGGSRLISVPLPAGWEAQADQLGVTVVDLVQSENGCLAPERASGDTTCEADQGDLAGQIEAEVAAGRRDQGGCRPAGAYAVLDLLDPQAGTRLSVDGAQCLSVRLSFPDGPDDNVAQSDTIAFGVRTVAAGPGDGVTGTPGTAVRPAGAGTAGTGTAGAGTARNPGRAATGQQGTGAAAGQDGSPVPGTTSGGSDGAGPVVGEQTTPVQVDGNSVAVQTESASRSIGDLVLLWGSVFVGVVLLGLAVFLWWSRRRRGEAS